MVGGGRLGALEVLGEGFFIDDGEAFSRFNWIIRILNRCTLSSDSRFTRVA
jgi:hypothetical protein